MRRALLGAFAITTSVGLTLHTLNAATRKEPYSGIEFDEKETMPFVENDKCVLKDESLVGVGVRCMMQLCWVPNARAYAVAFYGPSSLLHNDQTTWLQVPWAIELKWITTMRASHIAAGFKKNILPRLKRLPAEHSTPAMKDLDQMVEMLSANTKSSQLPDKPEKIATPVGSSSSNFVKGGKLIFTWSPSTNTLLIKDDDKVLGQITNPIIASSLIDCYVRDVLWFLLLNILLVN